ncbi:MAG: hypothetical protein ACXAE3_08945 [Candidatus Kariarchaeaceae archaeon]
MGGLFLTIWVTFTITNNLLIFLLFSLFGILGGMSLGALNGRKARSQAKYKNEYTAYAAMMFAAIVFLALYYFIFGFDAVTAKNVSDFPDATVVGIGALSGVLTELGLGLVIANSLAESTGY